MLPKISESISEGSFLDLILHTAQSCQVPPDMPLMYYLGGFGIAVNGKFNCVAPNGHEESCNLFLMPIAESGERKTKVASLAKYPHKIWLAKANKDFEERLRDYTDLNKVDNRKINRLIQEASEAEKEQKNALLSEIKAHRSQEAKPPKRIELFFDDTTTTALKRMLASQDGIMGHLESEPKLAEFFSKGPSSGLDLLCNAYDREEMIIDRAKEGRTVIPYPSVNICASFQPGPAMRLMRRKQFIDTGLAGRFIFALIPPMAGTRVNQVASLPQACLDWYHERVHCLLGIPLRLDDFGNPNPYRLKLDDDAAYQFQNFLSWAEPALLPTGALAFSKSWGSKLPGKILRLAGLLHCIDNADPINNPIHSNHMRQAIGIGNTLSAHAQYVYHNAKYDQHIEVANEILHWASSHGIQYFSAEEARRGTIGNSLKNIKLGIQYLIMTNMICEIFDQFAADQYLCKPGRNRAPRYRIAHLGAQHYVQHLAIE